MRNRRKISKSKTQLSKKQARYRIKIIQESHLKKDRQYVLDKCIAASDEYNFNYEKIYIDQITIPKLEAFIDNLQNVFESTIDSFAVICECISIGFGNIAENLRRRK